MNAYDVSMKSQVVKLPRPSFIRRVCFRLAALCLSSIVSLILLEGAVRVLGLAPPLPESYRDFVDDPYLPFKKKPNVVRKGTSKSGEFDYEYRYNSQGFRDEEHALKKPDGLFRIVGLGDSFAFGVGAPYQQTARWGYLVSKANERLGSTATWFYIHSHAARSVIRIYLDRLASTSKKRPGAARRMAKKEFLDSINRMAAEFERMVAIAQRKNAKVVLVCIPQINLDPLWGKRWTQWAARQRIALVNTQPALSRARRKTGKLLYWLKDQHCDPEGYEATANATKRQPS